MPLSCAYGVDEGHFQQMVSRAKAIPIPSPGVPWWRDERP